MFKALLLAVWYDLSDVKLAEALDDRASFRRFCGFSSTEATPERTAFVRFRRALIGPLADAQQFLGSSGYGTLRKCTLRIFCATKLYILAYITKP